MSALEPKGFTPDFLRLFFRKVEHTPFAKLPGFTKSRHFIPERANAAAVGWAKTLLDEEIQEELQKVYQGSKDILGLRHRQVKKNAEKGGGTVETDYFRLLLAVEQDEKDPTIIRVIRQITLLKPLAALPEALDLVFPVSMDEIVLPLDGDASFDDLVEHFEDIKDARGGTLKDDESLGRIEYVAQDGSLRILVKLNEMEMILEPRNQRGCLALLRAAQDGFAQIDLTPGDTQPEW